MMMTVVWVVYGLWGCGSIVLVFYGWCSVLMVVGVGAVWCWRWIVSLVDGVSGPWCGGVFFRWSMVLVVYGVGGVYSDCEYVL